MKGLTGNIIRTFSTQIPSIIISIVSGIFLTRLLGAEGKGVYAIFFLNIEIMVMIFAFGADMGIIYFGSNKKISYGKLQAIAVYLLTLFIPLLFIVVLGLKIDFLFPNDYDSLFFKFFLLGTFSLMLVNTLLSAFLKSVKSFKSVNRVTLTNSVLNALTFSSLFYLNSKGIVNVNLNLIFGISFVIVSLNTILWLISFIKNVPIHFDFKVSVKDDLFPFFKYISPVFLSVIINSLNYRLDLWLISYYEGSSPFGNAQVGLYNLAANFALFILLYSRLISSVLMPYLSEDNEIQRRKYFGVYSRIIFTTVVIFITVLALFGDSLIVFVYGVEFSGSATPFKILLIGMLFTSMSQLFNTMLFSKGKNKIAIIANSSGLIVTVVLDILLIPRYGIIGAAIATSFSYFFIFVVYMYELLNKEKIHLLELFLIKKSDFTQIFEKD